MCWTRLARAALALTALAAVWPAGAGVRSMRVLDWRNGLPVSFVVTVEQDPQGFLWITCAGGVFRYDGTEVVRRLDQGFAFVPGSVSAGAPVKMRVEGQRYEIELAGDDLPGTFGGEPFRPIAARVGPDDALWVASEHALVRRAAGGSWEGPWTIPDGGRLQAGPKPGRGGTLLVPCDRGVYRVDPAGRFELVARVTGALDALDRADGSTAIGCFPVEGGRVYEVRDGTLREIDRHISRFMALAERGAVLWIAYDNQLVSIGRDGARDRITAADGLPSGGAMLVDREGSLWVGTFRGLVQFPEPDSIAWRTEMEAVGIRVLLEPGAAWMSSWTGMWCARRGAGGWVVEGLPAGGINAPCADATGTVWAAGVAFPSTPSGEPQRHVRTAELGSVLSCAPSRGGGVWFPAAAGLFLVEPPARAARPVVPADGAAPFEAVLEDSRGRLWGARGVEICSADGAAVRAGAGQWTCTPSPPAVQDLIEMDSGAIWVVTFHDGVWRSRDGRFEPIPGGRDLASRWTSGIAASPSGGVWIVGEGNFLRVRERTDLPAGWEILERIGPWQGVPTAGVYDVAEDADGSLWAATNLSLVRIPASARRSRPEPPPVVLVEASVDGRPVELEPGQALRLPYSRNRLALRFAALSYRDPGLIRYRTRLNPDEPWSPPTRQPSFQFADLPPRRYHMGVEASLDGRRWSPAAGAVTFEVLRPWHGTWWFRALAALSLAAVTALVYRLRVASLLRVERQRMRIAMDLHDEVGSGLGSIGVLAGLLSRQDLPASRRADLSARIAGLSHELSQSLGDIVWSLRAGAGHLDSLWARILDRARPLFAAGSPVLQVAAPEAIPRAPLSLAVRRNAALIAVEALHNAARHAQARHVVLRLAADGAHWTISIEDDGSGIPAASGDATRRGLGLEGMRIRAEQMGGSVAWESRPGEGTRVVLRFRSGRE